jgi:hypothetical protein
MSLTAGLPWRHPAVVLGVILLLLSWATIAHEEHLQSVGALPQQGPIRLFMAIGGSVFWAWCTIKMVGEPHTFIQAGSLVNAERDQRRARLISKAGYAAQTLSIAGILAIVLSRQP